MKKQFIFWMLISLFMMSPSYAQENKEAEGNNASVTDTSKVKQTALVFLLNPLCENKAIGEYVKKGILTKEEGNDILNIKKILNKIHDDRLSQIRLLKRDTAPEHKKWFVNVLDSKIPTKESDKNQILYDCLSQLFDKLCDLGCMSSENDNKKVFIYRFSGFNNAYPLDRKIQWKGSNTLLGYITRCLTSDKVNRPMVFRKVASFFDSESEKEMNLASAKHIRVSNFDKEKNDIDQNFVKAVEILRRCGFINAEYTSKRR